MTGEKMRTVVCGSTFGQFYLEALRLLPEQFEVVGLLARGSERSRQCAGYYGIPLYTAADQLPDDIDLACVVLRSGVLGGKGTELSLRFLEQGVHVVQEQPVHYKDMTACMRAARKHGAVFRTGDHYIHLPEVRRFIACAKALLEHQPALYIDAAFASQVSYPMMHIFLEALPSIRPWKTGTVARDGGPFHVLTGTLGTTPAILRVHNEVDPGDPDNYLHLLHRASIGCEGGSLSLADTHGPVFWQPRLHIPEQLNMLGELAEADIGYMLENSLEALGSSLPSNYRTILAKQWPQAIARELLAMREMTVDPAGQAVRSQQELLCARQWQEITAVLGYPVLRPNCSHQPLPAGLLKAAAVKIRTDPVGRAGNLLARREVDLAGCTQDAEQALDGILPGDVRTFAAKLEQAVFCSIIYTFQQQGLLIGREKQYSPADVLARSHTAPRHEWLVRRWLALLCEKGCLQRCRDNYLGTEPVSRTVWEESWQEARRIWDGRLGPPLTMDYLIRNAEQLPQLMSGEQEPALLLFPEGKIDYARACYRDVMAQYLNRTVAQAVLRISAAKPAEDAWLRIVEIGAGTGATTDEVAPALKAVTGLELDYLFTDVSNYFITAAKKRFQDCPWMRFGLIDIDQPFTCQGLQDESADTIIAAGVLDNARNIAGTVSGLMRAVKPGGWMLVTEPVHDFPEMLISQAFMMRHSRERNRDDRTIFLPARQWREIFTAAGAGRILTFPEDQHTLAPLGQKLFAVQKGLAGGKE